ncbi:MAG: hypothetical protein HY954_12335 [Deltaproteobacteria bacterium]|nr:hypothetical protein [Deltaproteobacteria bacterium]
MTYRPEKAGAGKIRRSTMPGTTTNKEIYEIAVSLVNVAAVVVLMAAAVVVLVI